MSPNSGKTPHITPMLYGLPREDTDISAWFASMKRWGVRQWMSFAVPDRPHYGGRPSRPASQSLAFLEDAWPGFRPYLDMQALSAQETAIRKVAELSLQNGMEFWYLIPFPLFPSRDRAVVEKVAPYFFQSGRINLYEPRLAELLKAEV